MAPKDWRPPWNGGNDDAEGANPMIGKTQLDQLYREYNRKKYVHPDPLEFLYDYPDVRDREIVALIASSLAYGRVGQILKSVCNVLEKLGPSPYAFLRAASGQKLAKFITGFRHRFATGDDIAGLLNGSKGLIAEYGSLNECFASCMNNSDSTVLPALTQFVDKLGCENSHLVPSPRKGSACKRLNLFLRWMVRSDAVDPGGWSGIERSQLLVPLDTHMARIGQMLRLTKRKSVNMKMVLEITAAFRAVAPDDPVKYDFALTRFGIRGDLDIDELKRLSMRPAPRDWRPPLNRGNGDLEGANPFAPQHSREKFVAFVQERKYNPGES